MSRHILGGGAVVTPTDPLDVSDALAGAGAAAIGTAADAIVAAGAVGTLSAKLRRTTQGLEDLKTLIVLAAGTNNIGDVDIASMPDGTGAYTTPTHTAPLAGVATGVRAVGTTADFTVGTAATTGRGAAAATGAATSGVVGVAGTD